MRSRRNGRGIGRLGEGVDGTEVGGVVGIVEGWDEVAVWGGVE